MTDERELGYTDTFIWYPEQANDLELPARDYAPILVTEEDITLLISTNRESFKRILSSILVGADLIYPDISHKVAFDYLREFDYPMSICSLVNDCIQSGALDDSLRTWMGANGHGGGTGSGGSGLPIKYNRGGIGTGVETELVASCDYDNLFAAITGLVDLAHGTITDLAERMEVSSNTIELIGNAVEAIPIIGQLPFDDLFIIADNWFNNLGENYDAAYTLPLRDEYRCDLFCIAKNSPGCTLTFEDMADYFAMRAGDAVQNISFTEAMDFFISQTFISDALVHAAHWMFASVLAYGSKILNVDLFWLGRAVKAMLNDVDPDWEILCEDCSEEDELPACVEWNNLSGSNWAITFEYIGTTVEESAIDNSFGNGAPSARAGFVTSGSNEGRYINVRATFTEPMRVQSASMQYWYQDDGNDSPRRRISLFDNNGIALANEQLDTAGAPKGAWTAHSWSGDVSGVWYIEFSFRHWGTNTAIYNAETMSAFLDNICMEVEPVTEAATPLIDTNGYCGFLPYGSITDLGGGYWRIDSEAFGGANQVYFREAFGREFKMEDVSISRAILRYQGLDHENNCHNDFTNWLGSNYAKEWGCNRAASPQDFYVTFKMVL